MEIFKKCYIILEMIAIPTINFMIKLLSMYLIFL